MDISKEIVFPSCSQFSQYFHSTFLFDYLWHQCPSSSWSHVLVTKQIPTVPHCQCDIESTEKTSQVRDWPSQTGLWMCLWGILLTPYWCWNAHPNMGDTTP